MVEDFDCEEAALEAHHGRPQCSRREEKLLMLRI